jgi:hypothetical protein
MGGRTAPLEGLVFLIPLSWIKKSEIFSLHVPGFVASEENMDPIILVSLKAHHTPMLILWNSTSWIILVLPADKYQLFWVLNDR